MTTAYVAATGCGLLALFQLALAAGAPFGRASWGGGHSGRLPARLRVASLVGAVIWVTAALVLARRGGSLTGLMPAGAAQWGTWVLGGLLALGALMNLASSSPWERFFWAPFAAVLSGLCVMTAVAPF